MSKSICPRLPTETLAAGQRYFRCLLPMGLAMTVGQVARGENQLDYRYENYAEENHRMSIDTHSVYFKQQLSDDLDVNGELTYDSISGATPVGTHNFVGNILTTEVKDLRRAFDLGLDAKVSNQTLSPGFSYSKESDYLSRGISLADAIDFNEKNTTLQFGLSHNFDSVRHADKVTWSEKNATEGIISLSQIISPVTVLDAAFTFGNDSGYLQDPYRLAEYHPDIFPAGFDIGVPEHRPAHRNKEILFLSATHYFTKLDGSIEGSYRFYHDSFGISANTMELTWHQHLSKYLILEPEFRFYEQSAANFYTTVFSGAFSTDPSGMHSSDYRLSEFYSLNYGLMATIAVNSHVHIIAGFHRYEMRGLDGTDAAMYPKANVVNAGISFLW